VVCFSAFFFDLSVVEVEIGRMLKETHEEWRSLLLLEEYHHEKKEAK